MLPLQALAFSCAMALPWIPLPVLQTYIILFLQPLQTRPIPNPPQPIVPSSPPQLLRQAAIPYSTPWTTYPSCTFTSSFVDPTVALYSLLYGRIHYIESDFHECAENHPEFVVFCVVNFMINIATNIATSLLKFTTKDHHKMEKSIIEIHHNFTTTY